MNSAFCETWHGTTSIAPALIRRRLVPTPPMPCKRDAVDGAGLEGVGEHRGEEGANAAELAALAHERFGERQRLGRSLAHDDAVAGADPVGEAKLRGVDADHFAAPACVRRRCSPNATMRWARFRSGPSIILPSKSIVPMPRAVASS